MSSAPADAALLDLLPDAIVELDAGQRVVLANLKAVDLTGYSRPELVGRHCCELLRARGPDGAVVGDGNGWPRSAHLPRVGALPEQEVLLRRADGSDVAAFVAGRYRRGADGRLEGAFLSLRDASRRVGRSPSGGGGLEIVSTVSHELRSPLTSVKGYTSLLLSRWGSLDDLQKQMMLEQIGHDADRVTRLITELLDISRLESGRLVLRGQLISLPALATAVIEKVTMQYAELEAESHFVPGFPRVFADPDKVEQVLTNLVENACKYASAKGVRIGGEIGDGDVAVWVSDIGEGIPATDLSKVFTKFFRRAEGRPSGSGLGLWISRGLVEAHGGRLSAESVEGQGSTFRFTLPIQPVTEAEERRW